MRVVTFASEHGFDAVTTAASDVAVPAVAGCVEALGIAGLDTSIVRRCRDKLRSATVLKQAGQRAPKTRLVSELAAVQSEVAAIGGYPVVVKPRYGAGGRGVSIVSEEGDLEAAIRKVQRYLRPDDGFLLQEWIGGHSIGVEAFIWRGRLVAGFCLSDQYTEGFVSPVGHGLPDDLEDGERARVLSTVEGYCKTLGLNAGPVNFDLRDTPDGLCLIEVNPRLGGNSITPLVRASCDVDLADATVFAALGEDPSDHLRSRVDPVPCATRMMVVRSGGARVVVRYSAERWQDYPGLVDLEVVTRAAEAVPLVVDDWVVLGRCLVSGRAVDAAIDIARRVAEDMQCGATLVPPLP